MKLEIDHNKNQAYLMVSREEADKFNLDDVIDFLKKNKIVAGILHDNIKRILYQGFFDKKIIVAQGVKMIPASFSSVKILVLEGETIGDIKPICIGHPGVNVIEGQVLAIKEGPGQDGYNIFGDLIPMKIEKDINFPKGDGTIVLEDEPRYLIAAHNGYAVLEDNKIRVEKTLRLYGDIDKTTGNVFFTGNVVLDGSIQGNYSMEVFGDVRILGNVNGAVIKTKGSLFVEGGIISSKIFVEKELKANSIIRSHTLCNHEIVVKKDVIDSHLATSKRCIIKGKVSGGSITAKMGIHALEVTGKTSLQVGLDPMAEKKRRKASIDLQKHKKTLKYIEQDIKKVEKKITITTKNKKNPLTEAIELIENPLVYTEIGEILNLKYLRLSVIQEKIEEAEALLKRNLAEDI